MKWLLLLLLAEASLGPEYLIKPECRQTIREMELGDRKALIFSQIGEGTFSALLVVRTAKGYAAMRGFLTFEVEDGEPSPIFHQVFPPDVLEDENAMMAYICETYNVREPDRI